jgi:BASS family bile acid:Na+ symporter
MLLSVLGIVVLPVALGVWMHARLGPRLRRVEPVFPAVSVAAIVVIIAIIVALNRDRLAAVAPLLLLAVALHNAAGLAAGYVGARLLRRDRRTARTLAVEVGMQNSGLAVALALQYFPALAALPGALFSVWHNLTGALLAARWVRRPA